MARISQFYTGFTTGKYEESGGDFQLHDIECIEDDILREIMTTRGTRVMMPLYGTRIPEMVFEINDAEAAAVVQEDLELVVSHEPRVELVALDVFQATEKNALIGVLKLNYLEFNVTKDLYIEVNSR